MWKSSLQLSCAFLALVRLAGAGDPTGEPAGHPAPAEPPEYPPVEPPEHPPVEPPVQPYPVKPCIPLCDLPPEIAECEETLLEEQRAATAVWAQAYANKDVDTMMSYVVDDYIQHNPNILSGREVALKYIRKRLSNPAIVNDITLIITQLNFVMLHVHRTEPGKPERAMADIYRLDGTCIAEHWDVQEEFEPSPPNPLAYF